MQCVKTRNKKENKYKKIFIITFYLQPGCINMLLCVESRGMPRQKKTMPRRCAGSIHIDSCRRRGRKSYMLIVAGISGKKFYMLIAVSISGKKSCMLIAAVARERNYACWELPSQGKEAMHADSRWHIGKEILHADSYRRTGKRLCMLGAADAREGNHTCW